jgi:hypothetical protein
MGVNCNLHALGKEGVSEAYVLHWLESESKINGPTGK